MKSLNVYARAGLLAAACAALTAPPASGKDWKFSSSVNYDTGKYGTPNRVSSIYVPFTLKRYWYEGNLAVTLPFLRQSAQGEITHVGGKPVRISRGRGRASSSSETGLGDILVRGAYILKREGPRSFDLAAAGRLKLPTANETKGLGTGEMDEGMGLEFGKELSPGVTLLADGYYTIIGDPPGLDLNNEILLDIGVYKSLGKNMSLTVYYETRSAIIDGNEDPRELSGTLEFKSVDGWRYDLGLLLGLSDGSPDVGLSAGLSLRF